MLLLRGLICTVIVWSVSLCMAGEHPLPLVERDRMSAEWKRIIEQELGPAAANPLNSLSRRGDALMFSGRFAEAVRDYQEMVNVDREVDASHWRLGIAYYYAGQYEQAAAQFQKYHSVDQVDRENGIWRYFSQYRSRGAKAAQAELLKYEKDDREPFPSVYRLFSKELSPEEVLQRISTASISATEREQRLFYSQLYLGLNHAVAGERERALPLLAAAVKNEWGATASYGPRYMWHVGRLEWERVDAAAAKKSP